MTSDQPPSTPPPPGEGASGDPSVWAAVRQAADEAVVNARRIRELRAMTGQLGEQVSAITTQLGVVGEQLKQTGRRHTGLAAAVSEDLAPG